MVDDEDDPLDDAEFAAEYAAATRRGEREFAKKRHAIAARYDAPTGKIIVELANGSMFGFPAAALPEIATATPAQLAEIEVLPTGNGLHWESLDEDYDVVGLQHWIFDKRSPMKELGRAGGRSRSAAKTKAARRNGALGGRPKGSKNRAPKTRRMKRSAPAR